MNPAATVRKPGLALTIFRNNALAARFWFTCCCLLLVAALLSNILVYESAKLKAPVIIIDSSGTYHVAPANAFGDAAKVQEHVAVLAVKAFLDRNPEGLDNPELFQQIYAGSALAYAKQALKLEGEFFHQRMIHQKVEVHTIRTLQATDDVITVEVTGQIIRNERSNSQYITDARDCKLYLKFVRNNNLLSNRRLPLVCVRMKYIAMEPKSGANEQKDTRKRR